MIYNTDIRNVKPFHTENNARKLAYFRKIGFSWNGLIHSWKLLPNVGENTVTFASFFEECKSQQVTTTKKTVNKISFCCFVQQKSINFWILFSVCEYTESLFWIKDSVARKGPLLIPYIIKSHPFESSHPCFLFPKKPVTGFHSLSSITRESQSFLSWSIIFYPLGIFSLLIENAKAVSRKFFF